MFNNTIKILIRQMMRNKSFSMINISGLAIGMASCVYILLYVMNELNYDRYHRNAYNIYRVTTKTDNPEAGYQVHFARCWQNWIYKLKEDVPEIEELVRFGLDRRIVKYNNLSYYETRFYRVDANVFRVFDFELIQGDPNKALKEPNSIVITETMAEKYFGDENPVGKTVVTTLAQGNRQEQYTITGVMKDTPERSHFHVDFLASIAEPQNAAGWFYTYIKVTPGTLPELIEFKFTDIIKKYQGAEAVNYVSLILQRLTEIHLYSDLDREIEPNGNITYVYLFLAVAFLILAIACINFMNLATVRWLRRGKDIGVRKVLGAQRAQLIKYIFTETFTYCGAALIFSIVLLYFFSPLVNSFFEIRLSLNIFTYPHLPAVMIGVMLFSGLLAGTYPAFVIARAEPIRILRTGSAGIPSKEAGSGFNMRKLLVVVQFSISIALIIGTLVIRSQMDYIQNKNLGFSKDQTIAIRNIPDKVKEKYKTLKTELLKLSAVKGVTAAMDEPSKDVLDGGSVEAEGFTNEPGSDKIIHALPVDGNIIDVMDMEMSAGSKFHGELSDKTNGEYILNEEAVRFIGWTSPLEAVGKRFNIRMSVPESFQPGEGRVIGVVKDFNYTSLKKNIKPLVLFQKTTWLFCVLIKVKSEDMIETLSAINTTWMSMFPDCPMRYEFLDEMFAALYRAEEKQNRIFSLFSFMAIGIACLGLFGLAAFTVEQRTKEIGIRKVLGASIPEITMMLSKEYTKWVLLANLIAWPAAYYLMDQWLRQFVYRTDLRYEIFMLAGVSAFLIAALTIIGHTLKAAMANPVKSIRHE